MRSISGMPSVQPPTAGEGALPVKANAKQDSKKDGMMKKKQFAISESVTGQEIKSLRKKLELTQAEFAALVNVSVKTVERWEMGEKPVKGPIVTLRKLFLENPQLAQRYVIPEKIYPLRLWYMNHQDVCTILDVDERERKIQIRNFTNNYIFRAFGRVEEPTFEQYEEFLESRCFPRTRDKMKIMLKELDLPFYDPMMIIERTQGRMAEDNFWIRIER